MNIRKLIRESIEDIMNDQLIEIDGFKFIDKKKDENNNLIWKYSKNINNKYNKKEDGDYIFKLFLAKTQNNNWYYKIFVYWKKQTKEYTSGKGKDFDLQFGPFKTLDELKDNLFYNLKNNILISPNNYRDDNKLNLNKQIYFMIDKIKDVYNDLVMCDDSYFEDLKKEIPFLFKEKPQVDLYISKNYPDEDDKQQLLMILNKIDSLKNLKNIQKLKTLF